METQGYMQQQSSSDEKKGTSNAQLKMVIVVLVAIIGALVLFGAGYFLGKGSSFTPTEVSFVVTEEKVEEQDQIDVMTEEDMTTPTQTQRGVLVTQRTSTGEVETQSLVFVTSEKAEKIQEIEVKSIVAPKRYLADGVDMLYYVGAQDAFFSHNLMTGEQEMVPITLSVEDGYGVTEILPTAQRLYYLVGACEAGIARLYAYTYANGQSALISESICDGMNESWGLTSLRLHSLSASGEELVFVARGGDAGAAWISVYDYTLAGQSFIKRESVVSFLCNAEFAVCDDEDRLAESQYWELYRRYIGRDQSCADVGTVIREDDVRPRVEGFAGELVVTGTVLGCYER